MIYIDVEKYLKINKCFPRGYKIWIFKSLEGEPEFSFTYKSKYHFARDKALEAYHKQFNTNYGIIEVSMTTYGRATF